MKPGCSATDSRGIYVDPPSSYHLFVHPRSLTIHSVHRTKSKIDNQHYSSFTFITLLHINITLSSFSHKQISQVIAFRYVHTVDHIYTAYPLLLQRNFRGSNLAAKHLHSDSCPAKVRQGRDRCRDLTRYPKAHGRHSSIRHHSDKHLSAPMSTW